MQPFQGWLTAGIVPQGSSFLATLGWRMERRWRSRRPGEILASLAELEKEIAHGMRELETMLAKAADRK